MFKVDIACSHILQGILGTSIPSLVSRWYAHHEKTVVTAMWTTGNQMGSVLAYPMGTLFCGMHDFLGGWPLIFYVPGENML